MYTIGSPIPFNKMRNYRNVFLKENNLEQDYIFYQTLPNLCHTLKRNESNSSYGSNKIEEIRINMKSSKKPDNKKEDNILNKTNSYFYCRENALYLPGKKNEIYMQEEEENKNYQMLNKKQKNYEKRKKNIIDPDKNFEKMKKLYKTNSTNIFNNNNTLLYLKPRNKKSLQSYYYSNMNSNNNIASNPFLYNTNKNSQIMDNHLLKYNTNDFNDDTDNSILNNYMSNKNNNLDLTDTELLFTKKIRQNSLNKIYKKPIYKTTNISKKSPNHKDKNVDSNSVTNKDEKII
jgi:hypothetical protein